MVHLELVAKGVLQHRMLVVLHLIDLLDLSVAVLRFVFFEELHFLAAIFLHYQPLALHALALFVSAFEIGDLEFLC